MDGATRLEKLWSELQLSIKVLDGLLSISWRPSSVSPRAYATVPSRIWNMYPLIHVKKPLRDMFFVSRKKWNSMESEIAYWHTVINKLWEVLFFLTETAKVPYLKDIVTTNTFSNSNRINYISNYAYFNPYHSTLEKILNLKTHECRRLAGRFDSKLNLKETILITGLF